MKKIMRLLASILAIGAITQAVTSYAEQSKDKSIESKDKNFGKDANKGRVRDTVLKPEPGP